MSYRALQRVALLLPIVLAAPGCSKQAEIDALRASQEALIARVAQLERNPTRPAVPPPLPVPEGTADAANPEAQAPRATAPAVPDASKIYAVPVGDSPVQGPADAAVTIVAFEDAQCPFCGRANATLRELAGRYPGKLRVVFKHDPLVFHPRAMPAAMALGCAHAQGKFWSLHERLFAAQGHLEDKDLETAAKAAELKVPEWRRCIAQAEPKAAIAADVALAKKLGVIGTPGFFINGRYLSGAQPLEQFKARIEDALAQVQKSRTKAADYYDKVVLKEGLSAAEPPPPAAAPAAAEAPKPKK